ncbi:cytochrome P450 [Xylariaceae sp. FL0594]|nr:cytochrome P450 [Xylariaceae sp. FL0594]
MPSITSLEPLPGSILVAALVFVGYILYQALAPPKLPNLPIVGLKSGEWFPLTRARWRNAVDMKTATETAYYEHKDSACILPVFGGQNLVHLPVKEFQWLVDQPDTELDNLAQLMDAFLFDYTIMDPGLVHLPIHISVLTGRLTREVGNLIPEIMEEVQHAVDSYWPSDTEAYTEVCAYDLMLRVTGQAINRMFIGLPLCRNTDVLDAATAFSLDVPIAATILHFFPKALHPVLAPIVTLPNRIHTNRFYRIVRPLVRQRLEALRKQGVSKADQPKDLLQWCIQQAQEQPDPYHGKVDTLVGRMMLNNFNSIHASSFAATQAILDLAAGSPDDINELRAEIDAALAEQGGEWNKRVLLAMPKMDSMMRESARLNSIIVTATNRMVANKKGITTPSGVHLPYGTMVGGPSYAIMHDAAIYPDPDAFRPFRFTEAPEGEEKAQRSKGALATTSLDFPAFGHGKHACAGRFFASSMLRLVMAYVLTHYDVEKMDKRPENTWFGANRTPPLKATVRVRRKKSRI